MKRSCARTAAVLLCCMNTLAIACPICFSGRALTTAQQLSAAERAVIVVPAPDGLTLKVVAVVKGAGTVNDLIPATVHGLGAAALRDSAPLLLLHGDISPTWLAAGAVRPEHADWLRRVATAAPGASATEAQWRDHVAFLLPYLDHQEPMLATIAYEELAAAPYTALRSLRGRLLPAAYARRLDDPARQQLYTLLYGLGGGAEETRVVDRRIDDAWKAHGATNLAALLAADLELHGSSRVAWIEKMYLADRSRTLPEILAALLALSVQGSANATIPRERVIQAYRLFMKERKPMAGFVAQDFAAWNYWDAGPEYLLLLKSDALQNPASRYAVVNYLMQSPRADAKAAVKALAAANP